MNLDASHVDNSIARALKGESGLDPEVLKIHGFSTPTMRRLFNNLCNVEDLVYLECGCYCGASFVAAFNNNPIYAIGIENFAQDFSRPHVREQLQDHLQKWRGTAKEVRFLEEDCLTYVFKSDRPIDVLFYDGEHSEQSQSKALPHFFDALADRFVFIVDDTNWKAVSDGTATGFQTLVGRVKIEQLWKLSGKKRQDDNVWWNGVAIFLCSKVKSKA